MGQAPYPHGVQGANALPIALLPEHPTEPEAGWWAEAVSAVRHFCWV